MKSHPQSSPESDTAAKLNWALGTVWVCWFGFCSLCACWCHLVDVCLLVLFTAESHCEEVGARFPGDQPMWIKDCHTPVNTTNEWNGFLLRGAGLFAVFKVGLQVVNMLFVLGVVVRVWRAISERSFYWLFYLGCRWRPALAYASCVSQVPYMTLNKFL